MLIVPTGTLRAAKSAIPLERRKRKNETRKGY
jgi:hypothetical protein